MHQIDPERELTITDDDSLYLYVNNDIKYGLFEHIVDSYYLDSQIKDDFQCNHNCYSQHRDLTINNYSNTCTHDYHHITHERSHNLDRSFRNSYIIPSFPTREQHARSVQNARSRFNKVEPIIFLLTT